MRSPSSQRRRQVDASFRRGMSEINEERSLLKELKQVETAIRRMTKGKARGRGRGKGKSLSVQIPEEALALARSRVRKIASTPMSPSSSSSNMPTTWAPPDAPTVKLMSTIIKEQVRRVTVAAVIKGPSLKFPMTARHKQRERARLETRLL